MSTQPLYWKNELQHIIDCNNHRHACKPKAVSFKTMRERAIFLFAFFKELRRNEERNHKVSPSALGGRHVQFMVDRWLRRELSPGTIQDYLSHLRVFAMWIGKDGMVREAGFYTQGFGHAKRSYAASEDQSWSAQNVDPGRLIARIFEFDAFVGAQLAMCLAFGLRVKEAIMFQPYRSVNADQTELTLIRGTKGGRQRENAIDSDAKRAALELARRVAVTDSGYLGRPGQTLQQNQKRFYNLLARFGVTHRQMGVTAHGLRHQFSNDQYENKTGEPSPIRGGRAINREVDRAARLQIARELGHSRENITSTYIGAVLNRRRVDSNGAGTLLPEARLQATADS